MYMYFMQVMYVLQVHVVFIDFDKSVKHTVLHVYVSIHVFDKEHRVRFYMYIYYAGNSAFES